jgi:hypothetical protein
MTGAFWIGVAWLAYNYVPQARAVMQELPRMLNDLWDKLTLMS